MLFSGRKRLFALLLMLTSVFMGFAVVAGAEHVPLVLYPG